MMIPRFIFGGLLLFVLFGGLYLYAVGRSANEDSSPANYQSYRDIPGVTTAEIEAIETIKAKYGAFSIAMTKSTECFPGEDGQYGGYSRQFRNWLGDLFGVPFETEMVEWKDLLDGLKSHKFQFTGDLTKTDDRTRVYFMTEAIAERPIRYYLFSKREPMPQAAKTRPLIYAFLAGSNTHAQVRESAVEKFETVFVRDYGEALTLLETGVVDAFLDEAPVEAFFENNPHITIADFYPLLYVPVSLSTANPEFKPVIDVVQKYLDHGGMQHLSRLYKKGHQEYVRHRFLTQLLPEEAAFLTEHMAANPILFAAEIGNYPACFYNAEEKEWQGIAIDVVGEIEEITGLVFRIANKPTDEWSALQQMLLDGEVAMVSELLPNPERDGLFLWADEPYTRDYYALISKTELPDVGINELKHYRIALPIDSAVDSLFTSWFPNHPHALRLQSPDECLEALERDDADLAMSSRNMGLRMTHYYGRPDYKINLVFRHSYDSVFGFNIQEENLRSIVSKAQKLVDVDMISERWYRKVYDYRGKIAEARIPYLVGLAVLLGIVLFLVSIVLVRKHATSAVLEEMVSHRTRELEIQTRAANVASQAKSEFLSRMSHEIRTPLNAVIGNTHVAMMADSEPEKRDEALEHILMASEHLLDILNNILDMAKIETGKLTLSRESFKLRKAMEQAVTMIKEQCTEKNIVFTEDYRSLAETRVVGDKLRLNQILINLLGNAVKFTENGGHIDFSVGIVAEDDRHCTVRFVVKDDGIGMSQEELRRLFKAFTQADASVAVRYGGTGLGLSISQNLVRLMNGEIRAESRKGEGAVFSFELDLPLAPPKRESTRARPLEIPRLEGKRLLLVEDMEMNRALVKKLLAKTMMEIDLAHDGQEAVDKFTAALPGYYDLIFMDIQMPILDGYEATTAIRGSGHPDATVIPIIAMTANAYQSDIDAAIESGMNGHLSKPVNIQILYETLSSYLLPDYGM